MLHREFGALCRCRPLLSGGGLSRPVATPGRASGCPWSPRADRPRSVRRIRAAHSVANHLDHERRVVCRGFGGNPACYAMFMPTIAATPQSLRQTTTGRDDPPRLHQCHALGVLEAVHAAVELADVAQRALQDADQLQRPSRRITRPLVRVVDHVAHLLARLGLTHHPVEDANHLDRECALVVDPLESRTVNRGQVVLLPRAPRSAWESCPHE